MSGGRAAIVAIAKSMRIKTDTFEKGKRLSIGTDYLRAAIMEMCYGRNLGLLTARTKRELDARIAIAADCYQDKLGYLLALSQSCVREAREALIEYRRLCALKRRRPDDEAKLLTTAKYYIDLGNVVQNLHSVESGIKYNEPSEYK